MFLETLLIILFAFFTPYSQDQSDRIEVRFTNELTFDDLVEIREDMAQKDIDIFYNRLEFRDDGKLKSISFRVDCNDGFAGSASAQVLYNGLEVGFYRDYNEAVKSPFGAGEM